MSSAPDFDYPIHQDPPQSSKGEHRPMTVGAITQHLALQEADKLTDKERAYLRSSYSIRDTRRALRGCRVLMTVIGPGVPAVV
jgi:hypothetical protein